MLPYLAIGGAVVPSLGLLEGGKLEYDHAFDRCTLKDFLAAIVCAGCNGVTGQRGRDILRIGDKLGLVAGSLAREDYIGDHVHPPVSVQVWMGPAQSGKFFNYDGREYGW